MIRVWALRRTSNQIVSFWIVVHKFSSLLNKYRVVVACAAFNIQVNTAHYCAIIQWGKETKLDYVKHSRRRKWHQQHRCGSVVYFFQSMARLENFRFRYAELKGSQFTGLLKNSLWIILALSVSGRVPSPVAPPIDIITFFPRLWPSFIPSSILGHRSRNGYSAETVVSQW